MEKTDLTCNLEERKGKQEKGCFFFMKKGAGLVLKMWKGQSQDISRILSCVCVCLFLFFGFCFWGVPFLTIWCRSVC